MKRLIKAPFLAAWRLTFPLRRPVILKLSAFLARSVPRPVTHCHVSEETGLVMDHMVRELIRLQKQVEHLQMLIEEQSARLEPGTFSVIGSEGHRRSAS